jgi:hypothetical protein
MKHVPVLAMTLAATLAAVGVARAHEQVPPATSVVDEPRSMVVSGDGVLDHGGGAKKAGDGGRVQFLRCYQRGVRVLEEPVSGAPVDALARGAALQARAPDGRKLAVYAVGSALCVLML